MLVPGRFTSTNDGQVPLSGGGTTNFLRADGTWNTPAGGSGYATPSQIFIANNYYWATNSSAGAGGAVFTIISTKYTPIFIPYQITISALGSRVNTAAAAGNFCMGVYANGTNNLPTGSVLAQTGNMSTTTAGIVTGALGANLQLGPGYYWVATQMDNTTGAVMCLNTPNTAVGYLVGVTTPTNLAQGNGVLGTNYTSVSTYGTFASGPTVTETASSTLQTPLVAFKVLSVP